MNPDNGYLARKNLERRLAPMRAESFTQPHHGWVKAIREALGMTTRQLATRMGVARSRVTTIEKAEVNGATTLKTLREAAEAINCKLVYAFVPMKPLDDILRDQVMKKIDEELARHHHTMRLENQAMDQRDLSEERERLVNDMLANSRRKIWDDKQV
ncbi:MAG: mobile mystery protein A [Sphingomonadales bacterium]|jgi:predicted DNA-binding mobile mystery protein A|nr:mobile mystery protein A [Sphingomonadales bacterium]MBK9269097.1 mobile mystery protein A [Sphingomonadales bacterium]